MTNMEKWNKIVDFHRQERFSLEDRVQKIWESIFSEILGYSTLFGDVDVQRSVQIGSTERVVADIIIKDLDQDLFIVEIKQHTLKSGEKQLLSYLKLLHIGLGILVNDALTIIAYDYAKKDHEQSTHVIQFKPDSPDGETFVELFSKPFHAERVRQFVIEASSMTDSIQEIKDLVDTQYIVDLLRADLAQLFEQTEIDRALEDIEIRIIHKEKTNGTGRPTIDVTPGRIKIGQAVQGFFARVFQDESLSEDMISKLCDPYYSKKRFNINRPVLIHVPSINDVEKYRKDSHGHARYYRRIYRYNSKNYLLCSQWTTAQEQSFHEWVKFFEADINV